MKKNLFTQHSTLFLESQSGSDFIKTHFASDTQPQPPGNFNTETTLKMASFNLYSKMAGRLQR